MRILLVRHPQAAIEPGRCYGRLDLGLSAAGEASLPQLVAELGRSGIGRVLTSPARRCRAVADRLSTHPTVDPRLLELHFGVWEGRRWDEVDRAALDAWASAPDRFAPPGGESGASLLRRVQAVADDLRAAGSDAIVIAHGGPLRLLGAMLRGEAPDLLAPAPPLGSITAVHLAASTLSTAHSDTAAHPPSTSPVNPPI